MVRIPRKITDALLAHAAEAHPEECCGVLLGRRNPEPQAAGSAGAHGASGSAVAEPRAQWNPDSSGACASTTLSSIVTRALRAENIAEADRTRAYQIDWQTLFRVFRPSRDGGDPVIGFYHSHPDGTLHPSDRDSAEAWPDFVYVIVPPGGKALTAWRKTTEHGKLERITIV